MENVDITTLVVHLVSGVIGAIIAGAIFSKISLGGLGNAVAGLIGGGVGGALLTTLFVLPAASFAAGMEPMAIVHQAAAGAGSGFVFLMIIGIFRSLFGGN
jgi:uncharacterized membrane protein YeaQ/YmgE (transglycosylase-associated protein family)